MWSGSLPGRELRTLPFIAEGCAFTTAVVGVPAARAGAARSWNEGELVSGNRVDDPAQAMAQMAAEFADLARAMSATPDGTLQPVDVVRHAASAVPGAEAAGISLTHATRPPRTVAATSDVASRVDQLQYDTGEGPCMQALEQSDVVWSADLATDEQWPAFAPRAVQHAGVRSMLSFRMFLTDGYRGALNFYASVPAAFDDLSISIGAIFAAYASLSLINDLHRDEAAHLVQALESCRMIGSAIGILMARELCNQEEAFNRLRAASQHTHRKLRDIADDVTQTGTLPNQP